MPSNISKKKVLVDSSQIKPIITKNKKENKNA